MEILVGYHVRPEPWQWLYLFLIAISGCMLAFAIAFDLHRSGVRVPWWLALPAILSILVVNPWGLIVLFGLHVELLKTGQVTATLISAVFTLFGLWAVVTSFAPRSWYASPHN